MPVFNRETVKVLPPLPDGARQIQPEELRVGQLVRVITGQGKDATAMEGRVLRARKPRDRALVLAQLDGEARPFAVRSQWTLYLIEDARDLTEVQQAIFTVLVQDAYRAQRAVVDEARDTFDCKVSIPPSQRYTAYPAAALTFQFNQRDEVRAWFGRRGIFFDDDAVFGERGK